MTSLTGGGIEELVGTIRKARLTTHAWHKSPDDFVDSHGLVARIKAESLRSQPSGYQKHCMAYRAFGMQSIKMGAELTRAHQ